MAEISKVPIDRAAGRIARRSGDIVVTAIEIGNARPIRADGSRRAC